MHLMHYALYIPVLDATVESLDPLETSQPSFSRPVIIQPQWLYFPYP